MSAACNSDHRPDPPVPFPFVVIKSLPVLRQLFRRQKIPSDTRYGIFDINSRIARSRPDTVRVKRAENRACLPGALNIFEEMMTGLAGS